MTRELGIVKCDLQILKNNKAHRTNDLSNEQRLFLRRGQEFIITLSIPNQWHLQQEALGKWTLTVTTGPTPCKQNGTKNTFSISSLGDRKTWSARVIDKDQDLWIISVTTPADAIVGNYALALKTANRQVQKLGEFMLLFNPWCEDDLVYLYNEAQRQEYILNEDGIIYLGTESSVQPHPWHFGQFEEEVADICINFLDMSKYYKNDPEEHYVRRNDPIYISRILSDIISERDEEDRVDFMVQGGWPSYKWISSVPILKQWFITQGRIAYGHHWIFAAILCTVLRCLGIPTRIVTNYNSAHNTYETLKKDLYYKESGARIHRNRNDSIWHFHVWNECWMERRDLQIGYTGWQVIDATAQHKYNGEVSCTGPVPVRAIKEGKVNLHYDADLIFSKVVTECVAWVRTSEGHFIKAFGNARYVGDSIVTKSIGSDTPKEIINKYKHPKGSAEENKVLQTAKQILFKNNQQSQEDEHLSKNPIVVYLCSNNSQQYGEDLELKVTIKNVSDDENDLDLIMGTQAVYDYGITWHQFWSKKFNFHLRPREEWSVSGRISYSMYETSLMDNNQLRVTALVKEPGDSSTIFTIAEQDVTVCKPSLTIKMPKTALQFQPTKTEVVFTNPLKETLHNCVIRVSGNGLLHKERSYRCEDVAPGTTLIFPITFTPTAVGSRRLYLQFENSKIPVINGFQGLEILPNDFYKWFTQHWEEYQKSSKEHIYDPLLDCHLSISMHSEDDLLYGQDLYISLHISNNSKIEKELCVVLCAQYIHESTDLVPHFWKQEVHFSLEENEEKTLRAELVYAQYADCLWESQVIRLTGLVKDATSTIYTSKDITVYKPQLAIEIEKEAGQYQPITATAFITNPLEDVLQECSLTASGQGLIHKHRSYMCQDIDPNTTAAYNITFAPTKTGDLQLCMEFECKQFYGVKTTKNVEVLPLEMQIITK
ncbi:protein 4.2-like [Pelobates fuscus]|uniref:protein 4.2-like n=1 Tax=Pelobates fuscus TaxID=191477 RepID=UPI002FE4C9F3